MSRCANECGWHVTLLRLITGPFGRRPRVASDVIDQGDDVSEERIRDEEDLIDTVLEIVYRVMWKGVEGFGENDWTVSTKESCLIFQLRFINSLKGGYINSKREGMLIV